MSDPEHLRKDAKRLLKQCRTGDASAIARVRSRLPQLANLADDEFSRRLQLAHVQHALAREQGAENWASMKGISDTVLENLLHEVRNTGNISGRQLSVAADSAEENIYAACIIGDSDGVLRHLEVDPSLVFAQADGWTPLHYIAASSVYKLSKRHAAGIAQCAMVLLDRNADPYARTSENTANIKGATAVFLAERSKNRTLLKLLEPGRNALLARGFLEGPAAGVRNQPMPDVFKTPEFRALLARREQEKSERNPRRQEIAQQKLKMKELLEKSESLRSAGVGIPRFEQRIAERQPKISMPTEEEVALRSFLLTVSARDKDLWRYALENGLDPNWPGGRDGGTPLDMIALGRFLAPPESIPSENGAEIAELFLAHGADPNRPRSDGRTPYCTAVRWGTREIVQSLLAHGSSPDQAKPVDHLIGAWVRMDVEEARKILYANPTVLASLTEEDCDRIVSKALHNRHNMRLRHLRMFAESGADLGVFGTAGATALHLACWHGNTEVAQFLLKHNAPVNARDYSYGVSPLAWAAHGSANCRDADEDYATIVRALRAAGSDFAAAVNRWGVSPETVATPAVADLLAGWK